MTDAPPRRNRRRWIATAGVMIAVAAFCWYTVNPPFSADEKRLIGCWRVSSDGEATHDLQFHSNRMISIRPQGDATFGDHGGIWSVRGGQLVARPFNMTLKERFDLAVQGLSNGRLQLGGWDETYGVQFVNDDKFELSYEAALDTQVMFDRINKSTPPLPEVGDEEDAQ